MAGVAKLAMALKPEFTVLLLLFARAFVLASVEFLTVTFVALSGCSKLAAFYTRVQVFTSTVGAESFVKVQAFFFALLIISLV